MRSLQVPPIFVIGALALICWVLTFAFIGGCVAVLRWMLAHG